MTSAQEPRGVDGADLDGDQDFDEVELDDDDFEDEEEGEDFDDDEADDDFDDDEADDEADDETDDDFDEDVDDDDEDDDDEDDDDEDGYEPDDVNRVEAAEYEAGDVNTISATAAPAGAPATATGEMPVEVLEYLARAMADDPDAVVVRKEQRRSSTVLRLHVAQGDMGRIIGRRGRTAQAIRTLVGVAGARDGVQTVVDIADD